MWVGVEDVGEVRAVSELDEGLELRSHEQRNGHDDGEKNKDDGKQSGNGSRQLLFVWLKYKTFVLCFRYLNFVIRTKTQYFI